MHYCSDKDKFIWFSILSNFLTSSYYIPPINLANIVVKSSINYSIVSNYAEIKAEKLSNSIFLIVLII